VVPVYEQWHLIPGLLRCLADQSIAPAAFETILVDNGSPDFVPPGALPSNVHLARCEQVGSYAARNHGVRCATGDRLVFTDADCRPQADWLQYMNAGFDEAGDLGLLAGRIEMVCEDTPCNAVQAYDLVRGIPQRWYVARGYATTANLGVSRPLFQSLDGFDAARFSGGDADFCRRAGLQSRCSIGSGGPKCVKRSGC